MHKLTFILGLVAIVIGLGAMIAKNKKDGLTFLADKFGDGWESSLAGIWLGWRLVALGMVCLMFSWQHLTLGSLFSGGHLVGTLSILAGIIFIMMRHNPSGLVWFEKYFGAGWRTNIFARFFDWPLLAAGIAMWFPDKDWYDVLKLFGFFIAFWLWTMFGGKRASKSTGVPPATDKQQA